MAKIFSWIAIFLFFGALCNAQVLLTENFEYQVGTLLTANGYTAHSGAGTNVQTVVAGNLDYPGYPATGIGNSLKMTYNGEDVNKKFSNDSIVSGSIYFSCLVKIDSAKTGDYFIHVANSSLQGITYSTRVFVKKANNGNLAFGLGKISTSVNSPKYTDSIYATGTTYLIIARYKFVDGSLNDEVSLWVNPVLNGIEPTPVLTINDNTLADVTSLQVICYRQGGTSSGSALMMDGVMVSRSWVWGSSTPNITWENTITVKDNGNTQGTLTFGESPQATNGMDPALGEVTLPPLPPTGVFDARFALPVTPVDYSLKDYRSHTPAITWQMQFQPGAGGYPFTLQWNSATLPIGSFRIKDIVTGSLINVDMKTTNQLVVTNVAINALKIEYSESICKTVTLMSGWNIVSVPLIAPDMTASALFSAATSPMYAFNNGYSSATTLANGKGYWVRYADSANITICGLKAGNSVPVNAGWNLIGVFENAIPVSAITTVPAGIISSPFYGYTNSYISTTDLRSGIGYWVRTSAAGEFIIPMPVAETAAKSNPVSGPRESSQVVISDNAGGVSTLYLGNASSEQYELPPLPPEGVFDARFNNQSAVSSLENKPVILLNSCSYPVTIVSQTSIRVTDLVTGGKLVNKSLTAGAPLVISNNSIKQLQIEAVATPLTYALEQNYPNPFNPATTIRFSTGTKGIVQLRIFNQLGELISTLLNKEMEAGRHSVQWNASGYPSGVYLYELRVNEYKSVKKLILMK